MLSVSVRFVFSKCIETYWKIMKHLESEEYIVDHHGRRLVATAPAGTWQPAGPAQTWVTQETQIFFSPYIHPGVSLFYIHIHPYLCCFLIFVTLKYGGRVTGKTWRPGRDVVSPRLLGQRLATVTECLRTLLTSNPRPVASCTRSKKKTKNMISWMAFLFMTS